MSEPNAGHIIVANCMTEFGIKQACPEGVRGAAGVCGCRRSRPRIGVYRSRSWRTLGVTRAEVDPDIRGGGREYSAVNALDRPKTFTTDVLRMAFLPTKEDEVLLASMM